MVFSSSEIATLNSVVDRLRSHPELLDDPTMEHFRAYLHSLGANVRLHPTATREAVSDPELWAADDISKYHRLPQQPVDPDNEEVTERANALKAEAQSLANDGNLEEALTKISQALELRPGSSMWWALRADLQLRLKRPLAAIEDATEALHRNPDSARALRVRGLANRHLGEWETANEDLNTAQRIDFSDSIVEVSKIVESKCKELREQRRVAEEERQRALRQQRAEEEAESQHKPQSHSHSHSQSRGHDHHHHQAPPFGGMPSGFPMGGMPGMGGIPPGFETLLQDPEVAHALQDPEVMMKLGSLMSNPGLMPQMLADPKIGPIMQRIMSRVNAGGMGPGMGMGMGMGGMPMGGENSSTAPPPQPSAPSSSAGGSKPTVNTDLD